MKTFKISAERNLRRHLPKVLSELSEAKSPVLLKIPHHGAVHQRFGNIYVVWAEKLNNNEVTANLRLSLSEDPPKNSRLLMLADESSPDTVTRRILDLGIRSSSRFYAVRCKHSQVHHELRHLITRLVTSSRPSKTTPVRILDAKVEGNTLVVVSTEFEKLEIQFKDIPLLKTAPAENMRRFEIDEDGAFIYWPDLDAHFGWEQLNAIVNPTAALKAQQKSSEFNRRFGQAIRALRQKQGLNQNEIEGLSDRQLQRIESGKCRATSRSLEILAKAHKLPPNQYLEQVSSISRAAPPSPRHSKS